MEDFVPFEIAKKLKEKGFKEKCLCHYIGGDLIYNIESPIAYNQLLFSHNQFTNIWHRDNIDAPTISQVLMWLRNERKIHIQIWANACGYIYIICDIPEEGASDIYNSDYFGPNEGGAWDTYENCILAGIEYVLDNLI